MIEDDQKTSDNEIEQELEDDIDTSVCDPKEDNIIYDKDREDNNLAPGTVVWAHLHSWYPAIICSPEEVPAMYKKFIPDYPTNDVFVQRFAPFNDVRIVKVKNIDSLAENQTDKAYACMSEDINTSYCIALATLGGNI